MHFKVLNFNAPNNSEYVFGFGCFDEYLVVTNDEIRKGLYGELNPNISKFTNSESIKNIDRNFISHKILEIEIIDSIMVVDIDMLPNINGTALKYAIDHRLNVTLLPRIVAYESLDLENKKIRINKAVIVTFDIFIR